MDHRHRVYAKAKVDPLTGMNQTETRYAARLTALVAAGELVRWRFEPVTFRMGNRMGYTPDFEVVMPDGQLVYHEVKGFWDPKARVKIKAAARLFNDRTFVAVKPRAKKRGGGWDFEELAP